MAARSQAMHAESPIPRAEIRVLYVDDQMVVIDKPSGLSVHRGDDRGDAFAMNETRDLIGRWVYPVHRLDRGTSGVLVFGLSPEAARTLHGAFEAREVRKEYLALVRGKPPDQGRIDSPMAKDGSSGESAPDVACITDYKTLHRCTTERLSLVRAIPRTGRRHQIRRHLRRINHPLAGDVNYGNGKDNRYYRSELGLYRLALHAQWLALPHPETGASIAFEASPPPDLLDVFDRLEIPPETYARPAQAIE